MTQTLEQMLSPGSYIFEQPIFSKVFDGMVQIIRDSSKNHNIGRPTDLELYQMLMSRPKGFVSFRNTVAEFKKSAGISPSTPLAKNLSMYIHGEVFSLEPLLRDYLEHYMDLKDGIVPDGNVIAYRSFSSQYQQN